MFCHFKTPKRTGPPLHHQPFQHQSRDPMKNHFKMSKEDVRETLKSLGSLFASPEAVTIATAHVYETMTTNFEVEHQKKEVIVWIDLATKIRKPEKEGTHHTFNVRFGHKVPGVAGFEAHFLIWIPDKPKIERFIERAFLKVLTMNPRVVEFVTNRGDLSDKEKRKIEKRLGTYIHIHQCFGVTEAVLRAMDFIDKDPTGGSRGLSLIDGAQKARHALAYNNGAKDKEESDSDDTSEDSRYDRRSKNAHRKRNKVSSDEDSSEPNRDYRRRHKKTKSSKEHRKKSKETSSSRRVTPAPSLSNDPDVVFVPQPDPMAIFRQQQEFLQKIMDSQAQFQEQLDSNKAFQESVTAKIGELEKSMQEETTVPETNPPEQVATPPKNQQETTPERISATKEPRKATLDSNSPVGLKGTDTVKETKKQGRPSREQNGQSKRGSDKGEVAKEILRGANHNDNPTGRRRSSRTSTANGR